MEVLLSARVAPRGAVVVRDATFAGRVGWRAVLAEPGRGTAVRSDVTSADPTRRLRVYPTALLASPADRTVAHLRVSAGSGTVTAPRGDGSQATTTDRGAGDGFGSVFERAAQGQGVLLLLLLAAFGWGAVHALSPGHGKAMVAAYLVGTRGTARHAVALGADGDGHPHDRRLRPRGRWRSRSRPTCCPRPLPVAEPRLRAAGARGGGVGRARARAARARAAPGTTTLTGTTTSTSTARHDHGHGHHHHDHADLRPRALLAMGASAGLIPCPSALVVLLGAVAQHQIGLGMVLIVAFSAGLAATLTGLGLLVVAAGRVSTRLSGARAGRVLAVLPALSAIAIVAVGVALTAQAVPKVL